LRLPLARQAVGLLLGLFVCLWARDTFAYTWMVRHGYTGCAPCHQDPSGGGLLTAYGRSVGGLVLDTPWEDAPEGNPASGFLFGAVELPDWLMVGGDARMLWVNQKLEDTDTRHYLFLMQADAEVGFRAGGFVGSGSIGYAEDGAYGAAITDAPEKNLVSRVHWLGYELDEASGMTVRAGRMNLPFGIRSVEHTLWARATSATSVNADQQHGVSFAWSPDHFRTELMAILGNYQTGPDEYRERGYSGYLEWWPLAKLGVGASSLVTHRELDPVYLSETWRQAHGLFARWATGFEPLVLLAEADYLQNSPKNQVERRGTVGYVQADLEMVRGLHLLVTGEAQHYGVHGTPWSWGAWLSEWWFMAPHLDLRIDNIYQSVGDVAGRSSSLTLLAQAHLYL
ncbi:MAG TPA: hypothetical protein VGQ57_17240, partial [Polyangiaceae bacterium]|nr:hypothetical protein [Polyangiaceae bacterium]